MGPLDVCMPGIGISHRFSFLVCVNILLISYDYYQFLEGCQSGVVERFAVPDQAAPNFVIYFTVYAF